MEGSVDRDGRGEEEGRVRERPGEYQAQKRQEKRQSPASRHQRSKDPSLVSVARIPMMEPEPLHRPCKHLQAFASICMNWMDKLRPIKSARCQRVTRRCGSCFCFDISYNCKLQKSYTKTRRPGEHQPTHCCAHFRSFRYLDTDPKRTGKGDRGSVDRY
jgi:hypothetical protein